MKAPVVEADGGGAVGAEMIVVVGPQKGRWRIGRHFGPEPVTLARSDLGDEEIQRLRDDPELFVNGMFGEA